MNRVATQLLGLACAAILASSASAATMLQTSGDIGTESNWNNLLPSSTNQGTIDIDGTVSGDVNYDGLFIDQTDGNITQAAQGGGNYSFKNGVYNMTGGTWSTRRGISVNTGQTFTVDGGTFGVAVPGGGGDGHMYLVNGGTFILDSGSVTVSTKSVFVNGSTLRINGGTFTVAGSGSLGNAGFHSAAVEVSFNGGTITAPTLTFGKASALTIGGSTTGSATFNSFSGVTSFDWLPGSLMSLTMSLADEWAEAQWNAGKMTYDGDNNTVLGNWNAVLGSIFSYDSSTETLSLVATDIPEPASLAMGLIGMALVASRRR